MNQAEIDKARKKLEDEIAKLDDAEQALNDMTPDQRLAEALHDMQCRWNHDDQCDWFYDTWPSTRGEYASRQLYVKKARAVRTLLPGYSDEQIITVAGALKG